MDPKDVVIARVAELLTAGEQQLLASEGSNHQFPSVPATVTWTVFLKYKSNTVSFCGDSVIESWFGTVQDLPAELDA
jgi:hypothetical protein